MKTTYTVLGIAGSLRKASTNKGLLRCAQEEAPEGLRIALADIGEIPLFNADLEAHPPKAVETLVEAVRHADALLLACPEYNYSLAPALKNALDWVSRIPGNAALNDKPVAIMGSGGGMGTARAQYHLRQVCVYLNLHPLNKPELFANAFNGAFDADGNVTDQAVRNNVQTLLHALYDWIARFSR